MHQIRMKGLLVAACLLASPLVSAAGFDCAQVKAGIDKRICDDATLWQLDDHMTVSYAQARARAGSDQHLDALLRDQRNWLSKRNAAIALGPKFAVGTYQERIRFLDHLFLEPDVASPLLSAIAMHVMAAPSAANEETQVGDWWARIGGDGTVFKIATEQKFDAAKSLPFDPGEVNKLITHPDDAGVNRTLALLAGEHLGGTYTIEGTADVVSWHLFSWNDHAVQAVPLPETLQQNSWTTVGALAEYQHKAYALQYDGGEMDTADLEAQPYLGGHWGAPVRLTLRYDVRLLPPSSYCAEANCADLTALASKIVNRYGRNHDDDALIDNLSVDDLEKFNALLGRVKAAQNLHDLPDFHGKAKYDGNNAYTGFGGETYFPIRWHGEVLLGRIGNATLGWRESEDWLLGIWRWDGHAFVPVLGMVTRKQRGDFLLGAWLPAKPPVTH